uniref:Uncharacterized protein n=1 Tax=Megaselia scalaris TaxID=36166 RepID=T1GHT7_MEGSC
MGGGRNVAECSGNKSASSNAVAKPSPGKKSKIPVPKGRKSSLPVGGAGESVEQSATSPTHSGNVLKNENEIEKENNNKEKDNALVKEQQKQEEQQQPQNPEKEEKEVDGKKETPLPKLKSCRTIIADSYYEILMTNPDILESLN